MLLMSTSYGRNGKAVGLKNCNLCTYMRISNLSWGSTREKGAGANSINRDGEPIFISVECHQLPGLPSRTRNTSQTSIPHGFSKDAKWGRRGSHTWWAVGCTHSLVLGKRFSNTST